MASAPRATGVWGFAVYSGVCYRKLSVVRVRLQPPAVTANARVKHENGDNCLWWKFEHRASNKVGLDCLVDTPLAPCIYFIFRQFLVYGRRTQ
jgi:hypothetical protein